MRKLEKVAIEVFKVIKPNFKILTSYDSVQDVLYLNFVKSPPQEADFARRFGDYIIRIKDGRIIGITILNAKEHSQKRFEDSPSIIKKPSTIEIT
jgi:uncharacterized protein YuzE